MIFFVAFFRFFRLKCAIVVSFKVGLGRLDLLRNYDGSRYIGFRQIRVNSFYALLGRNCGNTITQSFWRFLSVLLCVLLHTHLTNAKSPEKIPVCTADGVQHLPQTISDRTGGIIVAWFDFRAEAEQRIYAQRIDFGGKTT